MDFSQIKKIHLIGIGGIGVSAVAKFFKLQGKEVSGSDVARSEITEDLEGRGVQVFYGHLAENVPNDTDLVVYSPAISPDNPEILNIKILNIKYLSYPEFLGELSKNYYTIAVSGTHGKSTTTALIGLMLEAAGLDPLVIVGAKVPGWEMGNIRLPNRGTEAELSGTNAELSGRRPIFVVEACEHQANMLKIHPQVVVVTNVEPDHLDYYKTFDNVKAAFQAFTQSVAKGGLVAYNGDREAEWNWQYVRPSILKLLWQVLFGLKLKWRSFGFQEGNNYRATDRQVKDGQQYFNIQYLPLRGISRRETISIQLNIPGEFNIYNALAAMAVALEMGVSIEVCQKVLAKFKGLWRRFEVVGTFKLQPFNHSTIQPLPIIISDYAHHPTAIKATINAAREFYPGRRIVLIFQPHQHHRTKMLFNDFVEVLQEPDVLILSEIYEVKGREAAEDKDVSSQKLIDSLKTAETLKTLKFFYGGDLAETERLTRQIIQEGDVVIVMGAGDVDKVARNLIHPPSQ